MSIKVIHVRSGAACTILALAYPNSDVTPDPCPTLAFFDEQRTNPVELEKMTRLLSWTADNGPVEDQTKFRALAGSDRIFEFKTSGGLRLLCFKDGPNIIICTHGVTKLAKKKFKSEITSAEHDRVLYFKEKAGKLLLYGPLPRKAVR